MKMDPFEKKLSRHPFRPVPPDWKKDLLGRAQMAASAGDAATGESPGESGGWLLHLADLGRRWLWPHPAVWASLAALWMVTLGLNMLAHSPAAPSAPFAEHGDTPAAMDMASAMHHRLRLLLLSPAEDRPSSQPLSRHSSEERPRSQISHDLSTA